MKDILYPQAGAHCTGESTRARTLQFHDGNGPSPPPPPPPSLPPLTPRTPQIRPISAPTAPVAATWKGCSIQPRG